MTGYTAPTHYCDTKSQPRWTRKYLDRHLVEGGKHSCSLSLGAHLPFLCPRARCNRGPGNPNWAIYEKKKARDENRAPCYEQQQPSQPPPPPPAQDWSASTEMDISNSSAQQDPAPAEAAPACLQQQLQCTRSPTSIHLHQALLLENAQWDASRCSHLVQAACPPLWDIAQVCLQILVGSRSQCSPF